MARASARIRRPIVRCAPAAVVLFAVAMLNIAGCGGEDGGPGEVAAVVHDRDVLSEDVRILVEQYSESPANTGRTGSTLPSLDEEVATRFVLNYLIRLTLLEVIAAELGIEAAVDPLLDLVLDSVEPEEFSALNMSAEDVRTAETAGDLSRQIAFLVFPAVAVSEDEVQSVYQAQAKRYQSGWSATVHTAFFESRAEAHELRNAVQSGSPFLAGAEALGALEHGSMGVVSSAAALPEDILTAIGALESGEVSQAVEASVGWLLFFVEAREEIAETPYSEARQEIVAVLQDQERQRLFDGWFQDRLMEAEVEVDSFYGKWNATSGSVRSS